jgi:DNA polymerase III alpha subunit
MPDIDLDFDDRRRPDVLAYIVSRFGADKVAQIITYTTIGSRSAARDSSRVLDFPYQLGQKIVDAMPPLRMGRDTPIAACMLPERPENDPAGWDRAAPLRELASTDRNVQDVLLIAQGLEGRVRQDGLHAAAVVISDRPLQELIPVQRKPLPGSKNGELGPLTTQYDMHAIEELGLLKMDCLGLRNLTVIQDTLDMIEETAGIKYELLEIPLDDAATYRLISTNAIGVFQLEQPDIRRFAQALNPQNFDDIGALNALYRPGPMGTGMHIDYADRRNGRKHDWEPMHPATADILEPTFGLMVFQEQMMQVAQKLAGFTSAEADNLRRACGKKDPVALGKQHDKFVQGCVDQGFGKQVGEQVFQTILPFSDYAFNKCVTGETKIQLDGRTIEVQELHRRLNSVLPAQQGRTGATAADKYEGPCVCCKQRPAVWRGYCRSCRSYRSKFYSGRPGEGLRSLSLLEDGRIQPSPIKDVHYNGRAPVWTVRLADGSEITGTANHRHRTPDGWKQVRELAVGDSLLTASPHGHPSGQVRRQDAESYRAVPVRIVAIEYAGVQDVYDLEMGSAGHNWVGNGIVTHNSHAYAYGLITYWTAWFKANWPAHYMAALLSSVTDSTERREIYLAECRRMGLVVLPPDINQARGDFWARKAPGGGWELVFGLSGIKGVGGTCVEHLVGLRAAGGPFSDFWDFASRVDSSRVTQPVLEALIAAGAFDSMGYSRKGLTKAAPDIMREQQQHTKQVSSGVQFLFDEPPARGGKIDKTEWPKRTLQSKERAVLNTYVTSHPLDDLLPVLQRACDTDVLTMLEDPEGWAEREQVTVGGMIDHRQEKTTKKGKTMGTFSLVGLGGSLEMIVFPTQWAECAGTVTNGEVVKVTGQLRMQEGLKGVAPQFVASAIERIAVAEGPPVRVDVADTDPRRLQSLQIALRRFPGDCPVFLVTPDDKIIALPAHWGCERSAACLKALHEIAGSELAAIAAPAPVAVAGPAAVPSDW